MTELLRSEKAQRIAGWVYLILMTLALIFPGGTQIAPDGWSGYLLFFGWACAALGGTVGRLLPRPLFMRLAAPETPAKPTPPVK